MKKKYGHQSRSIEEQGRDPKRNYLLLNYETRIQGEDFLGYCLQAQNSPSINFRSPRKQGTIWYKQDTKYYPGNRSGDRQEDQAEGKYQQLSRNFPVR